MTFRRRNNGWATELLTEFQTGLARSAAESEYPGLWRGLTGAWMPELGQTGGVLFDLAGQRLNGGLSGAVWGIDAFGELLSFSGLDSMSHCRCDCHSRPALTVIRCAYVRH